MRGGEDWKGQEPGKPKTPRYDGGMAAEMRGGEDWKGQVSGKPKTPRYDGGVAAKMRGGEDRRGLEVPGIHRSKSDYSTSCPFFMCKKYFDHTPDHSHTGITYAICIQSDFPI